MLVQGASSKMSTMFVESSANYGTRVSFEAMKQISGGGIVYPHTIVTNRHQFGAVWTET